MESSLSSFVRRAIYSIADISGTPLTERRQGAQVKAKLSRMERVARPSFRLLDKSSREGIFPYFFS